MTAGVNSALAAVPLHDHRFNAGRGLLHAHVSEKGHALKVRSLAGTDKRFPTPRFVKLEIEVYRLSERTAHLLAHFVQYPGVGRGH